MFSRCPVTTSSHCCYYTTDNSQPAYNTILFTKCSHVVGKGSESQGAVGAGAYWPMTAQELCEPADKESHINYIILILKLNFIN